MNREQDYLQHIIECIDAIDGYTVNGRETLDDPKTQDAVIRRLQVMAESCLRLSDEMRANILKWSGSTSAISEIALSINTWKSVSTCCGPSSRMIYRH